ncbi:iron-uptake factor [Rahnella aquatilis CIP 78.65 = ATCC 33071]|uniref:Putative iron-regulated membrane protein n=1 Tax=Rahnella aquatilis (strain ATCC 33071 / DSM 4594 / JCM 1683 / NBRC 105701 / NCIMB 13365 / CIP 78.65) TaxID=745277 RepID=H2INZ5_RAHAC|nr:PepSY-associated TM helix domain-containing protein [Rahnella aquatilis]AEX51174.1 putative iron-regulated membrane protein [Rahnella aquatilis CIP 78.65 = ATCC 33071]KFD17873.1 iron-uptake factor [Rahnella aquatilis CIP 78.65 = ATCC 33071]
MTPSANLPVSAGKKLSARAAFQALLRRLHFYIGLFVGPFIFIAALTGTLYVLTPQFENYLYADALFTAAKGTSLKAEAQPLSRQIDAALHVAGQDKKIYAVRPAPSAGETTRVMFSDPQLGPSKSRAIFIDPVTLAVKGDMTVYGTSGILPFRTWLDDLHRGLLLGDAGRIYSELAASWLWVAALGGVVLWFSGRRKPRQLRKVSGKVQKQQNSRRWHSSLGLILLASLLFFSATGLTWSQWAGDNIGVLRAYMGWMTPAVKTSLDPQAAAAPADEHAQHHAQMADMPDMPGMDMSAHEMPAVQQSVAVSAQTFDAVVQAARESGIAAHKIEIRPTYSTGKAWTVTEVDRSWPTQVDAVSVDPRSLQIIDHVRFADFPLLAKLTRWGVDAHMGILFGIWNQVILVIFGVGLCVMIVWGYRLWWLRRTVNSDGSHPAMTLLHTWKSVPFSLQCPILVITLGLAISLPVMGASLLIFLLIDVIRWKRLNSSGNVSAF